MCTFILLQYMIENFIIKCALPLQIGHWLLPRYFRKRSRSPFRRFLQYEYPVAGHFVPCRLRNLPLRTTKNNRPTSSYHLYLPLRTYHFVPTTSYLPHRNTFLMFDVASLSLIRNLIILTVGLDI